jgi:apoptosis-inducing factor 3
MSARVLGDQLGGVIKKLHDEKGVKFMLGRKPARVTAESVTLDDGTNLPAELIVAGVGVRPNLALAEKAGITMQEGVLVDEFLETSSNRIFAAGDVARWPDSLTGAPLRVEHWVVAQRMGQVAARNMLGYRDRFDDVPFFWSSHYGSLSIQYCGHATKWDETRVEGDPMNYDCTVEFLAGGRRIAVATINRDVESLKAELAMERELMLAAPPVVP